MNRDDLFARARTTPTMVIPAGVRTAIFPAELGGGTWIGTNDAGLTFCLLNWNRVSGAKLRSRGEVIPRVLASGSIHEVGELLTDDSFQGVLPFRLVGFSLHQTTVMEWRWNGLAFGAPLTFEWEINHWFSSGMSDDEARRVRLSVCEDALSQPDARSVEWLRSLHRSHLPERGAFSICAHRNEAGTLSYTEIVVSRDVTEVSYSDTAPCVEQQFYKQKLLHNRIRSRNL